jgi:hypothetical protein
MSTYATAAALKAQNTNFASDGARSYVLTFKDYFRFSVGSSATGDDVTVIAPTTGPGRWIREMVAAPEWLLQATWHINSATGNNENDGLGSGTALLDGIELGRRLGFGTILQQTTINVHGTGVTNFALRCNVADAGCLYIVGDRTVQASGTITAATAINRAAPGTRATITTSATNFSTHVGRRVRISGGNANARLDERFVVDADLGGNAARITRPLIPAANRFTGLVPTGTTPANGDTFDIYTCPTINGYILLDGAAYAGTTQGSNGLVIEDLDIGQTGPNRRMVISHKNPSLFQVFISPGFVRCILQDNGVVGGLIVSPTISGSCRQADATFDYYGGVILSTGTLQLLTQNTQAYPDFDIYVEGSISIVSGTLVVRTANLSLGTVGFFNAGHGLTIPGGATAQNGTNSDSTHQLWGTVTGGGNAGVNVQPGGRLILGAVTPTVTGPGGNALVGGEFVAWADTPLVAGNQAAVIVGA